MILKGVGGGIGGGVCRSETPNVNSFCSQWSQLTSLVAFVAGKLTLKDMLMWRQVLENFLLESVFLLIPICKEKMLGKKAGNWNLMVYKDTEGQPRYLNLVHPTS